MNSAEVFKIASAIGLAGLVSVAGLHHEATGTGPAVVLVHAFQMDLRQWDEQVPALVGKHRVVRYDVRGHGRSDPPAGDYAAHEDLAALLRDLAIERASVVGHSMGGQIAVDFALAHPERVGRLVLVSPGISGHPGAPPGKWFQPIIEAVDAGQAARAAELWWEGPFMAGVHPRGTAAEPYRRIAMENARIWTLSRAKERPLSPPAIDRLAELKVPTLVITGERDEPPLRELAQRIAHDAPKARLIDLKGVGHMSPIEAPSEFNRVLVEFLDR